MPSEINSPEPESIQDLERRTDVRRALQQTGGGEPAAPIEAREWAWLTTFVLLLVGLGSVYYLLRFNVVRFTTPYESLIQRIILGCMGILLALATGRLVDALYIGRLKDPISEYNLRRILHVVIGLAVALIALSVLFATWYTTVVSLGVLSLILGFALQTPITSFIGWIYILVRAPYRVGDRIRIGEATGDVIDVGYLDTTLWEFGGEYLSTDHPSGRIIKFPNANVLSFPVYNYSWPLFPFIWNEITFHVGYDSDLDFVGETMKKVAKEEVGEAMGERISVYRGLLARTPVDQLEVRDEPAIIFRVSPNTWIEATVRYLVEPRSAGRIKTRLIRTMLERLNAEPDRVRFPAGAAR
jgi:small-conductance mechanosensitive channel